MIVITFLLLDLADHLGHGTHGAETAPGSGFKQDIYRKPDDGGCQHDAIESKAELSNPVGHRSGGVSPIPGNPEHPQKLDGFTKIFCPGGH